MEFNFLIHSPLQIKNGLLDFYLEAGWYRYGNKIFTIDFFPVFRGFLFFLRKSSETQCGLNLVFYFG